MKKIKYEIEEVEVLAPGSKHWALEMMQNGHKVRRVCWDEEDDLDSFLAIQDGMVCAFPNAHHYNTKNSFGGKTPAEFIKKASPDADDWVIYSDSWRYL